MINVRPLLLFVSTLSLLSVATVQAQTASNTSTTSRCIGYDNKGQAFVYVSCLYGGQIQQLCANWGTLFANGSLMDQLPAGLNCSGIMKTTIANCNGNMTCYSAPKSSNTPVNSTALSGNTTAPNTASNMTASHIQSNIANMTKFCVSPDSPIGLIDTHLIKMGKLRMLTTDNKTLIEEIKGATANLTDSLCHRSVFFKSLGHKCLKKIHLLSLYRNGLL